VHDFQKGHLGGIENAPFCEKDNELQSFKERRTYAQKGKKSFRTERSDLAALTLNQRELLGRLGKKKALLESRH